MSYWPGAGYIPKLFADKVETHPAHLGKGEDTRRKKTGQHGVGVGRINNTVCSR